MYQVADFDHFSHARLQAWVRLVTTERDMWARQAEAGDRIARREARKHSQKLETVLAALRARSE